MLIESKRYLPGDMDAWDRAARADLSWAQMPRFGDRVEQAEMDVARFARGECYAGVSWGKDSMVLADLVARVAPHVPLVWVRIEPLVPPESYAVRDAFVRLHPTCELEELVERYDSNQGGGYSIKPALRRRGRRYLTGMRGAESAGRRAYQRSRGAVDRNVCAPLIDWSARDVWAYLTLHDLPVHPSYLMSLAGALDRDRIRVDHIGGDRGTGTGRRQWERTYYPDVLAHVDASWA